MKLLSIITTLLALSAAAAAEPVVDFNRDVRPLLSDRCFQCHGPNEHDRQAGLRLDQSDSDEGAYQVIEPGSVADSEIWNRVNAEGDELMPPPDSSKPPLDQGEKEIIRRWIEQGAKYQAFWAFESIGPPSPPTVARSDWAALPIDRYVMRQLESEGLAPKAAADRRTLIRRLSLDLTGLPPTRSEIHEFLADQSSDAYEKLIDRLLARPQFGEHMARYWLDLVRFADTNGIHHDHYREMTPYRDWVIRAFNDNLPYDDFIRYQIAGDCYPEPTRDQLIASGFNRLHLIIDRGTALPEESYTRNVIDRVTSVGTAFMGLTVGCAVCHDHKYDPVTMKDFYQLFAFFNNLDGAPETGGRQGLDFQRGLQPPYIDLASEQQQAQLDEMALRVKQLADQVSQSEQQLSAATDEDEKKSLAADLKRLQEEHKQARRDQDALILEIPVAMVMKEQAERRPAYILVRGAYDNPGEEVQRDTPAFLPPMNKSADDATRLDLAQWLVAPNHPLTARVAVNRFWQQLFGVGIVKTSEDFGAQGQWPSHPELLDYLAYSLIDTDWNVKELLKQIVMSQTYRQSSAATAEEYVRDPGNRLLSRGSRFRLDSEVIRDSLLATSGLLNYQLYGKSVKPPQPKGLWEAVSMPSSYPRIYEADDGAAIYRRSLYTFWKRGMPPPQMTILNAPSRESCIARRERTNTPLQALLLLNEPQYLGAAKQLASTVLQDQSRSSLERLGVIYETITAQLPDAAEEESLLRMVHDLQEHYQANPQLAEALCQDVTRHADLAPAKLAAWTMLVSAIYNLDITKTRD